jgi:hypothetical protein
LLSSATSRRLIASVASGKTYVTDIQKHAADVVSDYGHHNDAVSRIASLGNHGDRPQHAHRDFVRLASSFGVRLEPAIVEVEHKNVADHGVTLQSHRVLYPHETFAAWYSGGDSAFRTAFLGDDGEQGLEDFWTRQKDHSWVKHHPGFTQFGCTYRHAIPVGVHADKGQHISRDKLLTIAWGSVMSRASTVFSKQLFTVCPDELLAKGKTDEQLYAVLVFFGMNRCAWLYTHPCTQAHIRTHVCALQTSPFRVASWDPSVGSHCPAGVCMQTCTRTHTHTHTHTYIHAYIHTHIHTYIHALYNTNRLHRYGAWSASCEAFGPLEIIMDTKSLLVLSGG